MIVLLFRKDIEPSCSYCRHGVSIGQGEIACRKHGIMSDYGYCKAFRYEPTKREPEYARYPKFKEISEEEFAL